MKTENKYQLEFQGEPFTPITTFTPWNYFDAYPTEREAWKKALQRQKAIPLNNYRVGEISTITTTIEVVKVL